MTHSVVKVAAALMEDPTERQWGYELSKRTGIRSGVLYPILRRMLEHGWVEDGWEDQAEISAKRPPRRYYEITGVGQAALTRILDEARTDTRFREPVGGLA